VRDKKAETSSVKTTPRMATATTLVAAMKLARNGGAVAPMKIVPIATSNGSTASALLQPNCSCSGALKTLHA